MNSVVKISGGEHFDHVYAHRENRHTIFQNCPVCGEDVSEIAIVKLVYTHEVCECGSPHYAHLVEQLWHKDCFIESMTG